MRDESADLGVVAMERLALRGDKETQEADQIAVEAPLEIRISGVPIAVVMRTPGADTDLVWGFLRSEGIVVEPSQVKSVRHCDKVDDPREEDNVMEVRVHDGVELDLAALRRNLYASSSCGICGKASMERALKTAPAFDDWPADLSLAQLCAMPARLRGEQKLFEATGGLHAAGLVDPAGNLVILREDVGRHNAVDKVIGLAFREGLDLNEHSLVVSGRVSFEVVQKALAARIQRIVAVSAPTSLAIELARSARIGLIAMVREGRANVYSCRSEGLAKASL